MLRAAYVHVLLLVVAAVLGCGTSRRDAPPPPAPPVVSAPALAVPAPAPRAAPPTLDAIVATITGPPSDSVTVTRGDIVRAAPGRTLLSAMLVTSTTRGTGPVDPPDQTDVTLLGETAAGWARLGKVGHAESSFDSDGSVRATTPSFVELADGRRAVVVYSTTSTLGHSCNGTLDHSSQEDLYVCPPEGCIVQLTISSLDVAVDCDVRPATRAEVGDLAPSWSLTATVDPTGVTLAVATLPHETGAHVVRGEPPPEIAALLGHHTFAELAAARRLGDAP